jgi:hypothetical protein
LKMMVLTKSQTNYAHNQLTMAPISKGRHTRSNLSGEVGSDNNSVGSSATELEHLKLCQRKQTIVKVTEKESKKRNLTNSSESDDDNDDSDDDSEDEVSKATIRAMQKKLAEKRETEEKEEEA